jgi:hypothetical protein
MSRSAARALASASSAPGADPGQPLFEGDLIAARPQFFFGLLAGGVALAAKVGEGGAEAEETEVEEIVGWSGWSGMERDGAGWSGMERDGAGTHARKHPQRPAPLCLTG